MFDIRKFKAIYAKFEKEHKDINLNQEGEEQIQEWEEQILNKEGQGVIDPQQYQTTLEGK